MVVFRIIFSLTFILAGLWLAGFVWFVGQVERLTPPENPSAAAIVVLTGGAGRVSEGVRLLAEGRGKKLLISGAYRDTSKEDLVRESGITNLKPEMVECCIALGYEAGSTIGNAYEAAKWARDEKFSTLLVVTAHYHLPRALLEFHRAMPDIQFVPYPLARDNVKVGSWWQNPRTAQLLMIEYSKYGGALLRSTVNLLQGE